MTTVYVVGFDPIEDRASVGGFNWFYKKDAAIRMLVSHLENTTHFVWFRTHETPIIEDKEAITAEIDALIQNYGSNGDWTKNLFYKEQKSS